MSYQRGVSRTASVSAHGAELEYGQVHRDNHAADQHAENRHDDGLHQARHAVDGIIDFRFVELRNLAGHGVERTGFFAYRNHLHDHVGKQPGIFHGALQTLAGGDLVLHAHGAFLVNDISRGAGDRLHGFDERHAGGEHGRQRAREAGNGGFDQNRADDWKFQHHAVQEAAHISGAFVEIQKRIHYGGYHDQYHPAS